MTTTKRRAMAAVMSLVMLVSCFAGFDIFNIFDVNKNAATSVKAAEGDNTDPFGMKLNTMSSEEANNLKTNPYGTTSWFPLFTKSELVVSKTRKGGDRHQRVYRGLDYNIHDDEAESYLAQSGGYSLIASVAADLNGTGRKEYIANIAYHDDSNNINIYVTDATGQRFTSQNLSNGVGFMDEVESRYGSAHMAITAGDFDGDGKDTIIAYDVKSLVLAEFEVSGSKLVRKSSSVTHIGGAMSGNRGKEAKWWIEKILGKHDGGSDRLRAIPSVALAVDDTDKDGKDELLVTANWNDIPKDEYEIDDNKESTNFQGSFMSVWDNDSGWKRSTLQILQENADHYAAGRLRFAGVTSGNVIVDGGSGADYPEIVVGGFIDKDGGTACDIDEGSFGLYMFRYNRGTNSYDKILNNQKHGFNEFIKGGFYPGDKIRDPLCIEAFAGKGLGVGELVFAEGNVYEWDFENSNLKYLDSGGRNSYFNDDDDGIGGSIIKHVGIQDAISGNFDGNMDGREQLYFTTVQKRQTWDQYFFRTWCYEYLKSQKPDGSYTYILGSNSGQWEWHKQYDSHVSLAAADMGTKDGILAKVKSKKLEYTKPEVMAILEAAPFFADLSDGEQGGNSGTSYGRTVAESEGTSSSTHLSVGVMAGYEYTSPITSTGGGVEATITNDWTWETTETFEREEEIDYCNDTNENAVLVMRTPITIYEFDTIDSLPGSTKQNPTMTIGVPGRPVTTLISVDKYNEAATQFENVDTIGDNVLATPGDPASYRSHRPSSSDGRESWDSGEDTSYSGVGTISQSVTDKNTKEESSTYEFTAEVSAFVSAGGVKAGFSAGGGFGEGKIKSNTQGVTKEGAVTSKDTSLMNSENYDFNWRFATWTTKLSGEHVPVLGYMVSDVKAPPSPGQNLSISEQTSTSMVLTWEEGLRIAESYNIYRYDPTNPYSEYIPIGSLNGSAKEDGEYRYKIDNLNPNTTYEFVVSGVSMKDGESKPSQPVYGTTLGLDVDPIKFTSPKNASAKSGEFAKFSVEITDWGDYSGALYRWQVKYPGKGWASIDNTNATTLSVVADDKNNGAMYRCIVYGTNGAGDTVPFYSDAAALYQGESDAKIGLEVKEYTSGTGTYNDPYTGTANYVEVTSSPVDVDVPATIKISHNLAEYEAAIYEIKATPVAEGSTEETLYVAIAYTEDGTPLFKKLVKAGDTFTVDSAVNSSFTSGYNYTGTVAGTYTASDNAMSITIADTVYTRYIDVLGGIWNTPAIVYDEEEPTEIKSITPEEGKDGVLLSITGLGSQYISADGKTFYAYTEGMTSLPESAATPAGKPMELYGTSGNYYVVSAEEDAYTYVAASGDEAAYMEITSEQRIYELSAVADATPTVAELGIEYVAAYHIDGYNDISEDAMAAMLTGDTQQLETHSVYVDTRTNISGGKITLTTHTFNHSDVAMAANYTITVANTTTGETEIFEGKTTKSGSNASANHGWTAPAPGLYAITASTGNSSETAYYLATGEEGKDIYTLIIRKGNNVVESAIYGDELDLSLEAKVGSVPEGAITYKYSHNGAEEVEFTGIFKPEKAGLYIVSAYSEDGTFLAASRINVAKINIVVSPLWDGMNAGTVVARDEIDIVADDNLLEADAALLPKVFVVISRAFDGSGVPIPNATGAYAVTLDYQKQDDGQFTDDVNSFLDKYNVTTTQGQFLKSPSTFPIYYTAGENGSVSGRYSDYGKMFASGVYIEKDEKLQFIATPVDGFTVDKWFVNGKEIDSADPMISNGGNILTTTHNHIVLDNTDYIEKCTIEVTFKSFSRAIGFSVEGTGGTITASTGDGKAIENNSRVSEGATVVFTAAPEDGKTVAKWNVNGIDYTWPGSDGLYREDVLTLDNIKENTIVKVSFKGDATYKITTSVKAENDGVSADGISLTAVNAADGNAVDLANVPEGSAITFTAPISNTLSVKEWQVNKGEGFVTLEGSGGEASYTVYNVEGNWEIRAIVATAQIYTLTYNTVIKSDGSDSHLAVKASHNGVEIPSGSQVPAYIDIDFEIELNKSWAIADWDGVREISSNPGENAIGKIDSISNNMDIEIVMELRHQIIETTYETFGSNFGEITIKAPNSFIEGGIDESTSSVFADVGSEVTFIVTPDFDTKYVDEVYVKEYDSNPVLIYKAVSGGYSPDVVELRYTPNNYAEVYAVYGDKPNIKFAECDNLKITSDYDAIEKYDKFMVVEKYSENVNVIITPDEGYEITEVYADGTPLDMQAVTWQDEDGNDARCYLITEEITNDIEISATAVQIPEYNLTLSAEEIDEAGTHGSLKADVVRKDLDNYQISADGGIFRRDSDITITAVPDEGYMVQQWTINGVSYTVDVDGTPITVTSNSILQSDIQGDLDISVRFTKRVAGITFGVDPIIGGGVILDAISGNTSYMANAETGLQLHEGASLDFTTEANPEYELKYWTINGEKAEGTDLMAEYSYISTGEGESVYISPVFGKVNYAVNIADSIGGTVAADPEIIDAKAPSGTAINFTATPDTGYALSHWLVNGKETETDTNVLSLEILADTDIEAVFNLTEVKLNFTADRSAKVTAVADGKSVKNGAMIPYDSTVEFTVAPIGKDMVNVWLVNDVADEATRMTADADAPKTYKVENITSELKVHVEVVEIPKYTVTLEAVTGGKIGFENDTEGLASIEIERGSDVKIIAVPDGFYQFGSWTVNGNSGYSADTTLSLEDIKDNVTISAEFIKSVAYPITLSYDEASGDSVSASADNEEIKPGSTPSTAVSVDGGAKVVFKANPASGRMVRAWIINGTVLTNDNAEAMGITIADGPISGEIAVESLSSSLNVTAEFEEAIVYNLPQSVEGMYTIENVTKLPADVGADNEIRKGGTVTFTIKPVDGKYIDSLIVNAIDCMLLPADGDVTAVKNQGGSYTVTLKNVSADVALTATVQEAEYKVSISAANGTKITVMNGDTVVKSGTKLPVNSVITIKATANKGYKLKSIMVNGKEIENESVYTIESDTTIKTSAERENTGSTGGGGGGSGSAGIGGGASALNCSITFETNGGSKIEMVKLISNTTLTRPTDPVKDGYKLEGWYTDAGLTNKYDFANKVTTSFTLYAKWEVDIWDNPFTDVTANDWFYSVVEDAHRDGLMNGTTATTFEPDADVTRAMFITVIYRMEGNPEADENPFTDVEKDSYYEDAVAWGYANGIVKGVSDTAYDPHTSITREQMAAILYRYAVYKGEEAATTEENLSHFADSNIISEYAVQAFNWAVGKEIINGKPGSILDPHGTATRAEAAAVLTRMLNLK